MKKFEKRVQELCDLIICLGAEHKITTKMIDLAYNIQEELHNQKNNTSENSKKLDYDVHIS